jgi:hypothetical protein
MLLNLLVLTAHNRSALRLKRHLSKHASKRQRPAIQQTAVPKAVLLREAGKGVHPSSTRTHSSADTTASKPGTPYEWLQSHGQSVYTPANSSSKRTHAPR